MEISFVHAENFKLDGGACFGVVPKSLWSKLYPPDENNMITFSLRNLLVKDGPRLILFDTGTGFKQNEKFRQNFFITGESNLADSLDKTGVSPADITDVIHTHLHFDHCGGTFRFNANGETESVFKNANYWCSKAQWEWAHHPNPREKASYLKENLDPFEQSGRLSLIENNFQITDHILLKTVNGHTDGQIVPHIHYKGKTLVYMADFIPTAGHVSLPYIAGFDTRPLLSMEEKQKFLAEAVENDYLLLFQHDPLYECCTVHQTEKGIKVKETGKLDYFLNR